MERVLRIINEEVARDMRLCGCKSVEEVRKGALVRKRDVLLGEGGQRTSAL